MQKKRVGLCLNENKNKKIKRGYTFFIRLQVDGGSRSDQVQLLPLLLVLHAPHVLSVLPVLPVLLVPPVPEVLPFPTVSRVSLCFHGTFVAGHGPEQETLAFYQGRR